MSREELLKEENQRLLDELEQAYRRIEEYLLASQEEQNVTYLELRERNLRLEHQLAELEQAHSALKETEALLVHSERLAAMGQLAASLVHEIRNPLSVIRGRAQLMMMRQDCREEDRRYLTIINTQIDRLTTLLDNVLLFARRQDTTPTLVNVNTILDELLMFIEHLLSKQIAIVLSLQPDLPPVLAEANSLQQVFLNLALNAADAMHEGGTLHITTQVIGIDEWIVQRQSEGKAVASAVVEEIGENKLVCTEFCDGGMGIAPADIGRVFEPFFTTKGETRGTGLGLTICRTIIERYRGNILVASQPHVGTTFGVFLPFDVDHSLWT
jgi:signal transduction histidine kinase